MERIWLQQYPEGVLADVDVHEFASLKDVLLRSCQRFGELPAYSNMGASLTYAELDRSSRDFAAYLQKSLGLHKGDRVALMMPNLLQYPVALFGVLRAGLVVVNVNPQYKHPNWSTNSRTRASWPSWCWRTSPAPCRKCWTGIRR
jgi:long-chain acyl-CoA synthetase